METAFVEPFTTTNPHLSSADLILFCFSHHDNSLEHFVDMTLKTDCSMYSQSIAPGFISSTKISVKDLKMSDKIWLVSEFLLNNIFKWFYKFH